MNTRDKDRKIKKISFEIYQDQEEELNNLFFDAIKYSRNNKDVPSQTILKMLEIVSAVWEYEDVYSFQIINPIYERFKKYDFKSKKKVVKKIYNKDEQLEDEEIIIQMDLRHFIEEIIILTRDKKYDSKKSCLLDLVIVINNICGNSLDKKTQKLLSKYMRIALAGEITIQYKNSLFSGEQNKPYTNHQLFQVVNDLINKKRVIENY